MDTHKHINNLQEARSNTADLKRSSCLSRLHVMLYYLMASQVIAQGGASPPANSASAPAWFQLLPASIQTYVPPWVPTILPALVVMCGAAWAIYTFRRNTKATHAKLVLELEANYRQQLPVLLALEYTEDYEKRFKSLLKKATQPASPDNIVKYTAKESKSIDALEAALRHFLIAFHIRKLGVSRAGIDATHAYYLRSFVRDGPTQSENREDLREYLQKYWPTVLYWAERAGRPLPERMVIAIKQLPRRIRSWWNSADSRPSTRRAASERPSVEEIVISAQSFGVKPSQPGEQAKGSVA